MGMAISRGATGRGAAGRGAITRGATGRFAWLAVPAAAALLLWPALWNGYPIVFADTGTYLSQAIHRYAGWDRPVFYSVFMLPLHLTLTVWPVVAAQALLAVWVLWLVVRVLVPAVPWSAFVTGVGVLSACTWLAWLVCELMPDLFTPLLVLVLGLLGVVPARLSLRLRCGLAVLAAFLIASQQSSLPLAGVLVVTLLVYARLAGTTGAGPVAAIGVRRLGPVLLVLPPVLAVLGLCTVNLAAHGRFSTAPFGNVFLLARVIYDGPGMAVLRRDCPASGWLLCPFVADFPPLSDDFLWAPDSPLQRAGGAKLVSGDADAIILAALRADPLGEVRAALRNTAEQLTRFDSGDGLEAWPAQVSPWIARDFPPHEQAAYAAARQQLGALAVPALLGRLHWFGGLGGLAACLLLLPVALPVNAAITGSLSTPHDRYQARLMWLAPFVAVVSLASLRQNGDFRPLRLPSGAVRPARPAA